ncbi:ribonucleotide reductase [Chroococcidiopsis sp.]|uniref:ribonucleotide reductase n=1 Tax=Chroococcidiopsis sp. TaxID=3088168 RepID=UPI003F366F82
MTHKTALLDVPSRKFDLLNRMHQHPYIGVTGRVSDWLHDSNSRYPVSCTALSVEDSMEGPYGIEYSWLYASKSLRYGAGVAIDLSKLREKGADNGQGLVASGPVSFASAYSTENDILRRGGKFKNGAVTVYLDATHPDIEEFLTADIGGWSKKAVYVDDNPSSPTFIMNYPGVVAKLLDAVRSGTVWLAKKRWYDSVSKQSVNYETDRRLYSNVCMEILVESRGTCLLSHVNLGQCTIENLVEAFETTMQFLCDLHPITGAGDDNYYLSPRVDKQVGLGVFGLANLLARYDIPYASLANVLHYLTTNQDIPTRTYTRRTIKLARTLVRAYKAAARVARKHRMKRAFTIAPTASASYRYQDLDGYTCAPEISPPVCHPQTKMTDRDSDEAALNYQYHPHSETAEEVGVETYTKLAECWQRLMARTGLAHSISYNVWNTCPVDEAWFQDWLMSPLVTTYYRLMIEQSYVDKSSIGEEDSDGFFTVQPDAEPSDPYKEKNVCTACAE